jgi:glycosyltransferase involved in cell wall biosynthesis
MEKQKPLNGKIIVLSRWLPPEPTGSAVIVGNLARAFSEDEMILAGMRSRKLRFARAGPENPMARYLATDWFRGVRGARYYAWPLLIVQFLPMLLKLYRLIRKEACRNIVVTYPDEYFLFLGYLVARLAKINLFPYFHNTYLENRRGWKKVFAGFLQPRVFSYARRVLVMSEGMVELYKRRYPWLNNCSALEHSFSEPIPDCPETPEQGRPLQAVLHGNINQSCMDAVKRINRAIHQIDDVDFKLITPQSDSFLKRFAITGEKVIRVNATTERDALLSMIREADICILPLGLTGSLPKEEYETIFPTRTIEYLISCRPILAHVTKDSFLHKFLVENECALVVTAADEQALINGLERLRSDMDLRHTLVSNALRTAEMFRADRIAEKLRRVVGHYK